MERYQRRHVLGAVMGVGTAGLAGCGFLSGSQGPPDPEATSFELSSAEDGGVAVEYVEGPSITADNLVVQSSDGARVQWHALGSTSASASDDVATGTTATIGSSVVNWPTDLTLSEEITLLYVSDDGSPTTLDTLMVDLSVLDLLTRDLPSPEAYVDQDRGRADKPRMVGELIVEPSAGTATFVGPGGRGITAMSSYFLADALEPQRTWGGEVDDETKLIGTNATGGEDELAFEPATFRGVSVRANSGVTLVVGEETVAEEARLVRYNAEEGVVEQS